MRVTLVHAEIQAAVVDMLEKRGINIKNTDVAVAFSMGRKNTGLSATVDIVDPSIVELPAAVVEEDEPVGHAATTASAPATVVEAKEVTNTFVAKTDENGSIAVTNEAKEDPPFEVDEDAASAAPATSSEETKKTTQSLFA